MLNLREAPMLSQEIVDRAVVQVRKGPTHYDYFFSRISTPDWLLPLKEEGFFSSPPAAISEKSSVRFPFWPESMYLARVASLAPEQAFSVMQGIPQTDNHRVHADLAKAAVGLPGPSAAEWALREIAWLQGEEEQDSPLHLYPPLPSALGKLVTHLADTGQVGESLTLLRRLLTLRGGDGEVSGIVDTGHYDLLLQRSVPAVLENAQLEGLGHLIHTLNDALNLSPQHAEDSRRWRPAIEEHEQNSNRRTDYLSMLVGAIRDGAEQLIRGRLGFDEVVSLLLGFDKPIFKRIVLHLLEAEGQHSHPIARTLLLDQQSLLDDLVMHEYGRLLQTALPSLGSADRGRIFRWLEEGPVPREDASAEERLSAKKFWQLDRLHGLQDGLPKVWKERYDDLVAELGPPEYPDFPVWVTIRDAGSSTPLEVGELEGMSPEAIAEYLRTWQPKGDWDSPTREGLGSTLRSVITTSPDRFVDALDSFKDTHPVYVKSLVEGLEGATNRPLNWPKVLTFLPVAISVSPEEAASLYNQTGQRTELDAVNLAVARLLASGFSKDALDITLRQKVWQIVDRLSNDPYPSAEADASATDPMSLAENSTRGKALEAAVQYALWVRRAMTNETEREPFVFSMDAIPEVRQCLERRLDPDIEQTRALRAILGRWYPWLLVLDSHWAEGRVTSIFPADRVEFQSAAWKAYITYCPAYNEPFRILRGLYSIAIDHLRDEDDEHQWRWYGSIGRNLGEHLMAMLWSGNLAWSDEDDLLGRFFANASLSEASHAIESVGRSLYGRNDVPSEILERLRVFWERLVEQVASGESDERTAMLQPFGWWFASGLFDAGWSFQQLTLVLKKAGGFALDSFVMVRLAELAEEEPELCLGVLETLFELNNQFSRETFRYDSRNAAQVVLQRALHNSDTEGRARSLIDKLIHHQYFQYRDLLDSNTPKKELRANFI